MFFGLCVGSKDGSSSEVSTCSLLYAYMCMYACMNIHVYVCVCTHVHRCDYLLINRAYHGGVQNVTKRRGVPHKLYSAHVHRVQPAGDQKLYTCYFILIFSLPNG